MLWLSLLVLMLIIAAAPGISMYVEHRNGVSRSPIPPAAAANGADPLPER